MHIFISWSGESSRQIANLIKDFLPKVLQATKPYFTPKDIDKGSQWLSEILKKLNECTIGIICITPENTEKPWIHFEAGALANRSDIAIVCPLLFGISKTNLKSPLNIFQATEFNKEDFYSLLSSINKQLGDQRVSEENLHDIFQVFYKDLEEKINGILEKEISPENAKSVVRNDRELLEEILELSRNMSQAQTVQRIKDKIANKKYIQWPANRSISQNINSLPSRVKTGGGNIFVFEYPDYLDPDIQPMQNFSDDNNGDVEHITTAGD